MAFIANRPRPEEDLPLSQQQAPLAAPTTGGAPSLVGTQPGGVPGAAASAPPTPTGTGFTNLQRYLEANTDQAKRLTGQVVDPMQANIGQFGTDVGEAGKEFQQNIIESNLLAGEGGLPSYQDVAADPTGLSEDQIQRMMQIRNAQFQGPGSIQEVDQYRQLQNALSGIQNQAELTGTEAGRRQLIGELAPQGTGGTTTLDELLLGGSRDALAGVREQAGGLGLGELETSSAAAVDARQKALEAASGQLVGQLTTAAGGIGTDVAAQQAAQQQQLEDDLWRKYFTATQTYQYDEPLPAWHEDYVEGQPRTQDISRGGVGLIDKYGSWEAIPKDVMDRFRYGTEGLAAQSERYAAPTLSASQAASPEQFARESALERIMGSEFDALNNALSGQAGGYDAALAAAIAGLPGMVAPGLTSGAVPKYPGSFVGDIRYS